MENHPRGEKNGTDSKFHTNHCRTDHMSGRYLF